MGKPIVLRCTNPAIRSRSNRDSHHVDKLKDSIRLSNGELLRRMVVENSPLTLKESHFNKDPVKNHQNWHELQVNGLRYTAHFGT